MTYAEQNAIRKALKHTWNPFFSKFGKLLPSQIAAIPLIMQGENIVLQSPTASGKTEAVVAPILERLIASKFRPPSVLYISPTRALIYDLYERLASQVEYLGLEIAVRTADKHQFKDDRPQDIILTTPESFDSLLCRSTDNLRSIRSVILDELHLLDSNYRGDQLKLDLARLREMNDGKLQYCALSATMNDPKATAEKYFSPVKVVSIPGSRQICWELFEWTDSRSIDTLLRKAIKAQFRKILFFCNSRKEVELLGQIIKNLSIWPKGCVFVHHGSLSFTERSKTEEAMKNLGAVICVATMSLEVGIDIGNIDLIVLVKPPPSVSSLLQRVGRGNRRLGTTNMVGLFTDEEEQTDLEEKIGLAIEGKVEVKDTGPCISVAIQQVLSYIYQNRYQGVKKEQLISLQKLLSLTEGGADAIISKLVDDEYIRNLRGIYFPTSKLTELGEKGQIHSNIPSTSELKIFNSLTGKLVGEIGAFEPLGRKFVLSGKRWEVNSVVKDKVTVSPSTKGATTLPYFHPAPQHGKFYGLLPPELRPQCCKKLEE